MNAVWLILMVVLLIILAGICVVQWRTIKRMKKKEEELKEELEESDMSIMLSQIQPHFLYNSLSAIRELCILDSQKAQKALEEFSAFLRGNMDSVKSKVPVHFSRELEHVKHYLHLEQIRFGDDLHIEYDIQEEDFYLPTLTIQPIVENAVKYGVGNKEEGGTVRIETKKENGKIVITIRDDGVGFDVDEIEHIPVQKDGRTHIGLSNVKHRLEKMVNGTMTIHSRKETGTVVQIILDAKQNEKQQFHGDKVCRY